MTKFPIRQMAVGLLALGLAAGCASTPEEEPQGPTAEEKANQAIQNADAVIGGAEAPCEDVGNAEDLLDQARTAAENEDYAKAEELANEAANTANATMNDCYRAEADAELEKAQGHTGLTADQRDRLARAEGMMESDPKRALEMLKSLNAELAAATMNYTVSRGDNLWDISGKSEVYGNPYNWPLIYKANSGKIEDADLIYPGQEFTIDKNPTDEAREAAVEHARNRGSWSIGTVEESDRAYLRR